MVHVVDKSLYGYGYREINQQLAKDNGELRQQLSTVFHENLRQREEIHRRDVQIVDLKKQLNELSSIRAKFEAIKDIVTDKRHVESIQQRPNHQTTSIQALTDSQCETRNSSPLRLPSTSQNTSINNSQDTFINSSHVVSEPHSPTASSASTRTAIESPHGSENGDEQEEGESTFEVDNSRRLTENVLEPIAEMSGEDEAELSQHNSSNQSSLPSPSRPNTPADDSLEPPNVTSVPPINHQERTLHTPSIWNCLDPLESDPPPQFSQRSIQSPAKSTGSSASAGLRISNNINSSSPIHPISRKANPNINADMFQSTPVQVQKSINISTVLNNKRSISDPKPYNQENYAEVVEQTNADDENVATKTKPKKGRAKKQPVRREIKYAREDEEAQDAPPARYNLRKRAKI